MSRCRAEVAQILVEHAVVEWRQQRRGEDQIGDPVLEDMQGFTRGRGLHEFHRQPVVHQGRQLFGPARIAVDRKNELHLGSQHDHHENRRGYGKNH